MVAIGASTAGNGKGSDQLGPGFALTMRQRESEADDFYEALRREGGTDDEQRIMRQAFAGMLWSKQYYGYNVPAGSTATRACRRRHPSGMPRGTRPGGISTPPTSCRCRTRGNTRGSPPGTSRSTPSRFAHIDPAFAKYQLLLLCREWFQHPNGALPAYEWSFDDVNPPVHAAAAYLCLIIDGRRDTDFLKRIFHKLLLNFTWWLNREDNEGNDLYSGGFLGSTTSARSTARTCRPAPSSSSPTRRPGCSCYCLNMLRIATVLAETDPRTRTSRPRSSSTRCGSPRR